MHFCRDMQWFHLKIYLSVSGKVKFLFNINRSMRVLVRITLCKKQFPVESTQNAESETGLMSCDFIYDLNWRIVNIVLLVWRLSTIKVTKMFSDYVLRVRRKLWRIPQNTRLLWKLTLYHGLAWISPRFHIFL